MLSKVWNVGQRKIRVKTEVRIKPEQRSILVGKAQN